MQLFDGGDFIHNSHQTHLFHSLPIYKNYFKTHLLTKKRLKVKERKKAFTEMGACSSKDGSDICDDNDVRGLKEKIRLLREEVRGVMLEMDKETKSHEKDMVVFAFKEAGWKTEKKKLKEEVKMLRKTVEEIEEAKSGEKADMELELFGTSNTIIEELREERAYRDEAVEKWKQLYHAIKIELDDLIQRTHNGDGLYWGANERMEALKMELQAKEDALKALKEQLASMEHEKYKRDRDIDILRQSLRIMTSKKEQHTEMISQESIFK